MCTRFPSPSLREEQKVKMEMAWTDGQRLPVTRPLRQPIGLFLGFHVAAQTEFSLGSS